MVGTTTALTRAQSLEVGRVLEAAGDPREVPAWLPGGLPGQDRGPAAHAPVLPVVVVVVVEVAADLALDEGPLRHRVPFVRLRPDLTAGDVTALR